MLSRAVASVFFEEHRPQKCRYMDYMEEPRSRSRCSMSRASRAACRVPCKRTLSSVL